MKSKLISFVICETTKAKKGKPELPVSTKSAPHYFGATVPEQFLVSIENLEVSGKSGVLTLKSYKFDKLLAEISFDLPDTFFEDALDLKEAAIEKCREVLKKNGGKEVEEFSEEYSIYVVSDYEGDPEQFFKHKESIAGLLKSEKMALDPAEIDYTLSSQLKYAKNDLVIVEWDGAFIFDPEGDIESTVELFELANLQLLRHRLMDEQLDQRLHKVVSLIEQSPRETNTIFKSREVSQALKEAILVRSLSISEFQDMEREIKLIGDWYSARLYELITKKFKLEEWRVGIKDKLDAIEDIYTVASENFSISWQRRSQIIEMIGWYVLLFGWLVLLILDIYFYKKP